MYPSFPNIYVAYDTILTYKIYRSTDNLLLGTLTRNQKHTYDMSFVDGPTQTLVTSSSGLSAGVFQAQDWLNSSDSSDSY